MDSHDEVGAQPLPTSGRFIERAPQLPVLRPETCGALSTAPPHFLQLALHSCRLLLTHHLGQPRIEKLACLDNYSDTLRP